MNRYAVLLGSWLYVAAAQAAGAPSFDETRMREAIRAIASDRFDGRALADGDSGPEWYQDSSFRATGEAQRPQSR